MVFCGKASLSCKNCRTRRIKCNKLQPECSQCTRAGKKCPGYRDQLSLMFRDETVKVRSKFQEIAPSSGSGSGSGSDIASPVEGTPVPSDSGVTIKLEDDADGHDLALARRMKRASPGQQLQRSPTSMPPSLLLEPPSTLADRGLHFYIGSFIFQQPHEPPDPGALSIEYPWLFGPATGPLASAVGLVGLANLTGDRQLREASKQQYVAGLQLTNQSLRNARLQEMERTMRAIVLMAMYEIVLGEDESFAIANVHVKGAAALMRNFLPQLPASAFRSLMQYCYSMLIPCYTAGTHVPPIVLEYIATGSRNAPLAERAFSELLLVAADLINMLAHVKHIMLIDGLAQTTSLLVRARELDARLAAWERTMRIEKQWHFEVCQTTVLPPDACFHGQFHRYVDMPTARIWGYYRWARILCSQLLLDTTERCPQSAEAAMRVDIGSPGDEVTAEEEEEDGETPKETDNPTTPKADRPTTLAQLRAYLLRVIDRTAEDMFISVPTYWRHPAVSTETYQTVTTPAAPNVRRGGAGGVGLPPMLFHLQVAGCAPGVSDEDWQWAMGVANTVWAQLGMQQARSIAEAMRTAREGRRIKDAET